jgi:hypothetical protein
MSAIDLLSVKESWAQSICPGMEKFEAMNAISAALHTNAAVHTERAS